jgi:2-polyprenyl-3-methyl-5-hydroxy-6-metoxy-1,4-benzoquinol methylase
MDLLETNLKNPISHWYYSYKFLAIRKLISNYIPQVSTVADIGAGSGLFSREILLLFPNSKVNCVDTNYLDSQIRKSTSRITFTKNLSLENPELFILTDILEHVPDPINFLKSYSEKAHIGSFFIITVPASKLLWSRHDEFLKHYRRYTKKLLNQQIKKSGLEVYSSHYLFSTLFPLAFIRKYFIKNKIEYSGISNPNPIINFIAKIYLKFDFFISRFLPFGISIITIAKRVK